MHPQGPIDNSPATGDPPRKAAGGLTVAGYFVILVGCAFAIFYTYQASRENVPPSTEQSQTTSGPSDQAPPNPKSGSANVAETAPSVAPTRAAAPAAQKVAPPAAPPQGTGPTPLAYAARAPAAAAPAPNVPASSQGLQPATAAQTAPSNDDLELAFNGHCRECHSFVKDDNRLGPNLYGVVGRKAGTVTNFAYSELVKGSGITWDEPTLDKWITSPNTLIPGNNMGAIFGGVADPAERKKIISFLKQDTQIASPGQGSPSPPAHTN